MLPAISDIQRHPSLVLERTQLVQGSRPSFMAEPMKSEARNYLRANQSQAVAIIFVRAYHSTISRF
jgi:hypothetical protein